MGGLNTMQKGILELEEELLALQSQQSIDNSFSSKMIVNTTSKSSERIKNNLERIHVHYKKGLFKHLEERNIITNLLLVIHYTILYVDQNAEEIAATIGVKNSEDFKNDVVMNLILDNYEIKVEYEKDF